MGRLGTVNHFASRFVQNGQIWTTRFENKPQKTAYRYQNRPSGFKVPSFLSSQFLKNQTKGI